MRDLPICYEILGLQLCCMLAVWQYQGIFHCTICQIFLRGSNPSCFCFWRSCDGHRCLCPFWPSSIAEYWWIWFSLFFEDVWICLSFMLLSLLLCHLLWSVVERKTCLAERSWSHRAPAVGRFFQRRRWSFVVAMRYSWRIAAGCWLR